MKICWAFFFFLPLFGDHVQISREAQIYFEAKNYERARQYYEELNVEKIPTWMNDVILYNMGTLYLAEGKWEHAIEKFHATTPRLDPPFPLLHYRLKFNSAYSHWQLAKNSDDNLKSAIYHYSLMQKEIELAKEAFCQLAQIEGAATCPANPQLEEMQAAAHQKLAEIFDPAKGSLEERFVQLATNHMMLRTLRQLHTNKENLPEMLLLNAIDEQELALTAGRLNQIMPVSHPEIYQFDMRAQQRALRDAEAFLPAVNELQVKGFEKQQCQKAPWQEVLPLFDKGLQNAHGAFIALAENNPRSEWIRKHQENAIKYWKDALKQMRNPPPMTPIKPEESKQEPESQAPTLNEILRSLQEMEQEDKSAPKFELGPEKKVDRPW